MKQHDNEFTSQEIIEFLMKSGTIDLGNVQNEMIKKQREELLRTHHSYRIWQSESDSRWRTYIPDESKPNSRRMVVKSSKNALETFLMEFYQLGVETDKLKQHTLRTLYPEWKEYKRLHTTASTSITRLESDWNTHYSNDPLVDIPICKLDKLTLDKWAHNLLQTKQLTKNAYYNITCIIRQELQYAVDLGIIKQNIFSEIRIDPRLFRKVKKKPDALQVFSKEEAQILTKLAWEDFENRVKVYEMAPLALLFQYQTGIRIGEACCVMYEDIEERPGYIHIQRMVRRDENRVVEHTKSDCGDRYIILTSTAKKLIETARERQRELHIDSKYIFSVNGKPLTERSISTLYTKYSKKMGLAYTKSSHTSRRTFVSSLLEEGVGINSVRIFAGHSDERTTLRNYCFDRAIEAEKVTKFENALVI